MNIEDYIFAIKNSTRIDKWHSVEPLTKKELKTFQDNGLELELTDETEPYPFQYSIKRLCLKES